MTNKEETDSTNRDERPLTNGTYNCTYYTPSLSDVGQQAIIQDALISEMKKKEDELLRLRINLSNAIKKHGITDIDFSVSLDKQSGWVHIDESPELEKLEKSSLEQVGHLQLKVSKARMVLLAYAQQVESFEESINSEIREVESNFTRRICTPMTDAERAAHKAQAQPTHWFWLMIKRLTTKGKDNGG